jgi:hypothetical protein
VSVYPHLIYIVQSWFQEKDVGLIVRTPPPGKLLFTSSVQQLYVFINLLYFRLFPCAGESTWIRSGHSQDAEFSGG